MSDILAKLRNELESKSDEKTRHSSRRFFKEAIKVYGVKAAAISPIGTAYYQQLKGKTKAEIFALCEELWQSGFMEESFIACNWCDKQSRHYTPADMDLFERWLNQYVTNWAACDTFCNHSVAALVEKYPELIARLKTWTRSDNRWVKRAAAVTLILPARHGQFLPDIFEIAQALLTDKDDMVQKGYGWMLKAASQAHQKEVFEFVMDHKAIMPRTALRYAIEKMPADLKAQAMAK